MRRRSPESFPTDRERRHPPSEAKEVFRRRFEAAREALLKRRETPWSEAASGLLMEMSRDTSAFSTETLEHRFRKGEFSEAEKRWFSELAALNAYERAVGANEQARFDALTGLYRNYYLEQALRHEMEKRRDPAYRVGALSGFYADVDRFKRYNDLYGHDTGDRVLKALGTVAQTTLERVVKEGRVAAGAYLARRYDRGEEFVGIFPGSEPEQVKGVVEDIRRELAQVKILDEKGLPIPETVTMSVGVASLDDQDDVEAFLGKMERASVYAKEEGGRNKVQVFTPEVASWAKVKASFRQEKRSDVASVAEGTEKATKDVPLFRTGESPLSDRVRSVLQTIRERVFDMEFPDPDRFATMLGHGLSKTEEAEAFLFYSRIVEYRALCLEQLSSKDTLTGVENRTSLLSRLEFEVAVAKQERHEQKEGKAHEVSILLLDLDFFKRINDDYGHTVGDTVLQEAGKLFLQFAKQEEGLVAQTGRAGGEEFVMVLSGSAKADAERIAENLRRLFVESVMRLPDGADHTQTISIGVASTSDFAPDEPLSVKALLHKADVGMYRSKADGRNRVTGYSKDVEQWWEEEQKRRRKGDVELIR